MSALVPSVGRYQDTPEHTTHPTRKRSYFQWFPYLARVFHRVRMLCVWVSRGKGSIERGEVVGRGMSGNEGVIILICHNYPRGGGETGASILINRVF